MLRLATSYAVNKQILVGSFAFMFSRIYRMFRTVFRGKHVLETVH